MRWLTIARRRARALVRRHTVESEMDEELRFHFEMAVADGVRRGLSPGEALADARREFGGMEQVKEAYRDARGVRLVEHIVQDARYGLRALRRTPSFTAVVVLTLGLGIGANTAIFSVVHGVLLRALPYADVDRVAAVWETDTASGTTREPASVPDFFDYVERARSFTVLAGIVPGVDVSWIGAGADAERVHAAAVTANFFTALGVMPLLGRTFTAAEAAYGGPYVAVVSERFWRSRLGSDPRAVGRTLRFDDFQYTIIGVIPGGVRLPDEQTMLWLPFRLAPTSAPRATHFVAMVGRLKPGATLAAARAEMAGIARQLEGEHPREDGGRGVSVEPLREVLVGEVRQPLVVLLGAVALVLLIACANAASLLLARLAARMREVAVRAALGASGRRLAQQFFVESLLLTLASAVLGAGLAFGGLKLLVRLAPANLPRLDEVGIDGTVLAVTLGVSVAIAMGFGLLPSGGGRAVALRETLAGGESRSATASRSHRRFRSGLVVAEVALSLVLAVGAGLLIQSFWRLRHADPGFSERNVLRLRYQLPASRYPSRITDFPAGWGKIMGFQRELLEKVGALPGVRSVAIAANDPLTAGFTNSFVIEGREAEAQRGQAELATRPASPSYFESVGIPVLRGRGLDAHDAPDAPLVVVINEAAARKYFSDENPIGKRIRFWGKAREIVGVVGNERFGGLTQDAPPAMYPSILQAPMPTATLLVRTAGDPRRVLPGVRRAIRDIDHDLAPFDVATMDEALSGAVAQQRFLMIVLGVFASSALLLALVGIYGVTSYTVAQRAQEIGVRMALGATRRDVVRYVLGQGVRLAMLGSVVGTVAALAAGRLLATQLFGVAPTDPPTFALVIGAMLVAAALGSYLPARRAAAITPVRALREG